MPASFDTLAYAKDLEKAGFTRQQAELQAKALNEIITSQLATKGDLRELEMRMIVRFGGIVVACTAILLAFCRLS